MPPPPQGDSPYLSWAPPPILPWRPALHVPLNGFRTGLLRKGKEGKKVTNISILLLPYFLAQVFPGMSINIKVWLYSYYVS